MSETTRCLFYVGDVLLRVDADGKIAGQVVKLNAAYDPDPNSPNHAFWKATPTGSMELQINNPDIVGFFKTGKKYWIDLTPVE